MIFIHIASYCDPELLPTIEDCLANADRPHELRFGICWQKTEDDHCLDAFLNHPQFRIDIVRAEDSRGCCWARARSQSLYDGEDHVLQLDGHHRFEQGWDTTLIDMLRQTGAEKPIITAYGGSYDAIKGKGDTSPWKMKAKPFGKDGALLCVPVKITGDPQSPIPARFLSGHFMFTLGAWCREVPYDPQLYFHGEEPTLSVRSYTHGYDLFHPHKIVIWHQYHREGRPKHWDDHPALKAVLDATSKARVRKLLGMEDNDEDLEGFGFGSARTLADYEAFAGIDFHGRRLRSGALEGVDPPSSGGEPWGIPRKVIIHWKTGSIEIPDGTTHVHYYIDDAHGVGMWDHKAMAVDGFQCPVIAEFDSCREPAFLIVWPHTKDGPTLKKYSLPLSKESAWMTSS